MTAVPARVAGVGEIIMVTPGASPESLLAARIAGVDRVFEIGGAQAVAALAYGTASVPRVDKIVGPGNAYVAAAKRLVFGDVGIDSVAGPSEVLVIADDSAAPAHVASDLLAQAEHDADAIAILVTPSRALAEAVAAAVAEQLRSLSRAAAARSIRDHGAAIVTADLGAAIRLANRFAPEHLELHVRDAARVSEAIRTAGAIFVGPFTPEAAGDYLAGPNHVLPTGGAARYASPLGVWDYVKRTTVLEYDRASLLAHRRDITLLAGVEGLEAHARSVTVRTDEP
jgi:histidinol dehydrogenase